MFFEALEKILASHATAADIRRIESGQSTGDLWRQIEDAGFLDLLLPEAQGCGGLAMPELFFVLECLGRHAMPLPVAQSMVARALVGGRATLPTGMVTLATQLQRPAAGGFRCPQTPSGAIANHVLAADGDTLLLLPCALAQRELVGDPRSLVAHLTWPDLLPTLQLPVGGQHLDVYAAALMAAQLSGAMQRCFDMALGQCNNRVQFGKSIGKFQALQHQISVMAEHVLAAAIAAEAAFRGDGVEPAALAAAIAKSRASEAAALVAATAHAVHGAIGITDEFDLGIMTRRLHDWRMAYGAEHHWNRLVGAQVLLAEGSLADFVRNGPAG